MLKDSFNAVCAVQTLRIAKPNVIVCGDRDKRPCAVHGEARAAGHVRELNVRCFGELRLVVVADCNGDGFGKLSRLHCCDSVVCNKVKTVCRVVHNLPQDIDAAKQTVVSSKCQGHCTPFFNNHGVFTVVQERYHAECIIAWRNGQGHASYADLVRAYSALPGNLSRVDELIGLVFSFQRLYFSQPSSCMSI